VVRGPGGSGVIKCYKQIKVTVYKSNAHATTGQEGPEMEQRYSSTLSLTLSNPIFSVTRILPSFYLFWAE
jgi:hypothetical protein